MNQQEIYKRVRDHLLAQNAKSRDANGACLYRSPDGLKCAIGCLIADENYSPQLEGWSFSDSDSDDARVDDAVEESIGQLLSADDKYFLYCLQRVHDNVEVGHWPAALAAVAEMFLAVP